MDSEYYPIYSIPFAVDLILVPKENNLCFHLFRPSNLFFFYKARSYFSYALIPLACTYGKLMCLYQIYKNVLYDIVLSSKYSLEYIFSENQMKWKISHPSLPLETEN